MAATEAFSLLQAWWAAPIGTAVGLGGGGSIFSETRFGVLLCRAVVLQGHRAERRRRHGRFLLHDEHRQHDEQ
jgi:hypothetical protein